jgi:hypoxanthine phosphoribosyltransferase
MRSHHIQHRLFSAEAIRARIDALVEEMAADRKSWPDSGDRNSNFAMVGILRGSFVFLADLVRALYFHGIHPRIDFMTLESYGSGTESSGRVTVSKDISLDVSQATVIVVDDILDTGRTLSFAVDLLRQRGARAVKSCVLLDKPARRVVPMRADFRGFEIEDEFVVGYGLDYDGRYRELPYIARVTFTGDETD